MNNMENNNIENIEKPQADKSKKTKILVGIIAGALIVAGAVALVVSNIGSDNDTTPVIKTEIATDSDGTPTVVQGTTPNGTLIENSTYPDGTQVEFATTASGEYATEADGSYIINYVETATLAQNDDNSANSDGNNNSANNNSNSSSSKSDSSNKTNSSSSKDSSSSSNDSNNSSNSSSSSGSGSSSGNSNNSSNSSSSNTSSSSSSSSSGGTTSADKDGDAKATINGSSYNVGDKIRVSYYLQSSVKFCAIQCDVNYDSGVLSIDDSSVNMDNLVGAMSNTEIENQIKFLATSPTAVNDFSKEKLLFSCEFEVTNATNSDVTLNVVDILDNDVLSIPSENYTITAKVEKI